MTNNQNPATAANTTAVEPTTKGDVTYSVAGQDVHLNYTIVRNYLTKGGGKVTDADLVQFIAVCKFNQLNPFLNEAYLVKYGDAPAQMVVSKEALMKRAESCKEYDGFEAGIIVMRKNEIVDVPGSFIAPGDTLVGGWAIVHRSDKKFPYISRVNLSEYSTGKSLWNGKPSTMIRKVAIVQAMREAFPAQLGAMYTQEEQNVVVIDGDAAEVKEEINNNANKTAIRMDAPASPAPAAPATPKPETKPAQPATNPDDDCPI